jgi:chromosome segregation ATPase
MSSTALVATLGMAAAAVVGMSGSSSSSGSGDNGAGAAAAAALQTRLQDAEKKHAQELADAHAQCAEKVEAAKTDESLRLHGEITAVHGENARELADVRQALQQCRDAAKTHDAENAKLVTSGVMSAQQAMKERAAADAKVLELEDAKRACEADQVTLRGLLEECKGDIDKERKIDLGKHTALEAAKALCEGKLAGLNVALQVCQNASANQNAGTQQAGEESAKLRAEADRLAEAKRQAESEVADLQRRIAESEARLAQQARDIEALNAAAQAQQAKLDAAAAEIARVKEDADQAARDAAAEQAKLVAALEAAQAKADVDRGVVEALRVGQGEGDAELRAALAAARADAAASAARVKELTVEVDAAGAALASLQAAAAAGTGVDNELQEALKVARAEVTALQAAEAQAREDLQAAEKARADSEGDLRAKLLSAEAEAVASAAEAEHLRAEGDEASRAVAADKAATDQAAADRLAELQAASDKADASEAEVEKLRQQMEEAASRQAAEAEAAKVGEAKLAAKLANLSKLGTPRPNGDGPAGDPSGPLNPSAGRRSAPSGPVDQGVWGDLRPSGDADNRRATYGAYDHPEDVAIKDTLKAKDVQIADRDGQIADRDALIGNRDKLIADRDALIGELQVQKSVSEALRSAVGPVDGDRIRQADADLKATQDRLHAKEGMIAELTGDMKDLEDRFADEVAGRGLDRMLGRDDAEDLQGELEASRANLVSEQAALGKQIQGLKDRLGDEGLTNMLKRDDLEDLQGALSTANDKLAASRAKADQEQARLNGKLTALNGRFTDEVAGRGLDRLLGRDDLEDLQGELETLDKKVAELVEAARTAADRLAASDGKVTELLTSVAALRMSAEGDAAATAAVKQQLDAALGELVKVRAERDGFENAFRETRVTLEATVEQLRQTVDAHLEAVREVHRQAETEQTELKAQIRDLQAEVDIGDFDRELGARIEESLEERLAQAVAARAESQAHSSSLDSRLVAKSQELADALKQVDSQVAKLQEMAEAHGRAVEGLRDQASDKQAQLTSELLVLEGQLTELRADGTAKSALAKEALDTKIGELNHAREQWGVEVANLSARLDAESGQRSSLESMVAALNTEKTQLTQSLADAADRASVEQTRVQGLKDRLNNAIKASDGERSAHADAIRAKVDELDAATKRIATLVAKATDRDIEDTLSGVLGDVAGSVELEELEALRETASGLREELTGVRADLMRSRDDMRAVQTRLEGELSELQRSGDARARDVDAQLKAVKDEARVLQGNLNALADAKAAIETSAKAELAAAQLREDVLSEQYSGLVARGAISSAVSAVEVEQLQRDVQSKAKEVAAAQAERVATEAMLQASEQSFAAERTKLNAELTRASDLLTAERQRTGKEIEHLQARLREASTEVQDARHVSANALADAEAKETALLGELDAARKREATQGEAMDAQSQEAAATVAALQAAEMDLLAEQKGASDAAVKAANRAARAITALRANVQGASADTRDERQKKQAAQEQLDTALAAKASSDARHERAREHLKETLNVTHKELAAAKRRGNNLNSFFAQTTEPGIRERSSVPDAGVWGHSDIELDAEASRKQARYSASDASAWTGAPLMSMEDRLKSAANKRKDAERVQDTAKAAILELQATVDALRVERNEVDERRVRDQVALDAEITELQAEVSDLILANTVDSADKQTQLETAVEAKRVSDAEHAEERKALSTSLKTAVDKLDATIAEATTAAEASRAASQQALQLASGQHADAIARMRAVVDEGTEETRKLREKLEAADGAKNVSDVQLRELEADLHRAETSLADTTLQLEQQRQLLEAGTTEAKAEHENALATVAEMEKAHQVQLDAKDADAARIVGAQKEEGRKEREQLVSEFEEKLKVVISEAEDKHTKLDGELQEALAEVQSAQSQGSTEQGLAQSRLEEVQKLLRESVSALSTLREDAAQRVQGLEARIASEADEVLRREEAMRLEAQEQSEQIEELRADVEGKNVALQAATQGASNMQALLDQRDESLLKLRQGLMRTALSEGRIRVLKANILATTLASHKQLEDAKARLQDVQNQNGLDFAAAQAEKNLAILAARDAEQRARDDLARITKAHDEEIRALKEVQETIGSSLTEVSSARDQLAAELQGEKQANVVTAAQLRDLAIRETDLRRQYGEQVQSLEEAVLAAKTEADEQVRMLRSKAAASKLESDKESRRLKSELDSASEALERSYEGSTSTAAEASKLRRDVAAAKQDAQAATDRAQGLEEQLQADFDTALNKAREHNAMILQLKANEREHQVQISDLKASLDEQTVESNALQLQLDAAAAQARTAASEKAQLGANLQEAQTAAEQARNAHRWAEDAAAAAQAAAKTAADAGTQHATVLQQRANAAEESLQIAQASLSQMDSDLADAKQAAETNKADIADATRKLQELEVAKERADAKYRAEAEQVTSTLQAAERVEREFQEKLAAADAKLSDFTKQFAKGCDPLKPLEGLTALGVARKAAECAEQADGFKRLGDMREEEGLDAGTAVARRQRWEAAQLREGETLKRVRDGMLTSASRFVRSELDAGLDNQSATVDNVRHLQELDKAWIQLRELRVGDAGPGYACQIGALEERVSARQLLDVARARLARAKAASPMGAVEELEVANAKQGVAMAMLKVDPTSVSASDLVKAVEDAVQSRALADIVKDRTDAEAKIVADQLRALEADAAARRRAVDGLPVGGVQSVQGLKVHQLHAAAAGKLHEASPSNVPFRAQYVAATKEYDAYQTAFDVSEGQRWTDAQGMELSPAQAWPRKSDSTAPAHTQPPKPGKFKATVNQATLSERMLELMGNTNVYLDEVSLQVHGLSTASAVLADQANPMTSADYWQPTEADCAWYQDIAMPDADDVESLSVKLFSAMTSFKEVWYSQRKHWLKDPTYTLAWLQTDTKSRTEYASNFIHRTWMPEAFAYPIMRAAVKKRPELDKVIASDSLHFSKLHGVIAGGGSHVLPTFKARPPQKCIWVTVEHLLMMSEDIMKTFNNADTSPAQMATFFHIAMLLSVVQAVCAAYKGDEYETGYDDCAVHEACAKRDIISFLKLREPTKRVTDVHGKSSRLIPYITSEGRTATTLPKYLEMKYLSHVFPSSQAEGSKWAGCERSENHTPLATFAGQTVSKSYFKYRAGPFSNIYTGDLTNVQVAEGCTALAHKLKDGKSVFVFGYGPSGAGKTSSLIYFNKTKTMGIIPQILITLGAIKMDVTMVEYRSKKPKGAQAETSPTTADAAATEECVDLLTGDILGDHSKRRTLSFDGYGNATADEASPANSLPIGPCIVHYLDTVRSIMPTTNNEESSRSHAIIYVDIGFEDPKQSSKIAIGDFAGVENRFHCDDVDTQTKFETIIRNPTSLMQERAKLYPDALPQVVPTGTRDKYPLMPAVAACQPDASPEDIQGVIDQLQSLISVRSALSDLSPEFWGSVYQVTAPKHSHGVLVHPDAHDRWRVTSLLDRLALKDPYKEIYNTGEGSFWGNVVHMESLLNKHYLYTLPSAKADAVVAVYGLEEDVLPASMKKGEWPHTWHHDAKIIAKDVASYIQKTQRDIDPSKWPVTDAGRAGFGGSPPQRVSNMDGTRFEYNVTKSISTKDTKVKWSALQEGPWTRYVQQDNANESNTQVTWAAMRDRVMHMYRNAMCNRKVLRDFVVRAPGVDMRVQLETKIQSIMQELHLGGLQHFVSGLDLGAIKDQCVAFRKEVLIPNSATRASVTLYCRERLNEGLYINQSLEHASRFLQLRMREMQIEENTVPHYPRGCITQMCESPLQSCVVDVYADRPLSEEKLLLIRDLEQFLGPVYTPAIVTVLNLETLPGDSPPKPYVDYSEFEVCVQAFRMCALGSDSVFTRLRRAELMKRYAFLNNPDAFKNIVWLLIRRIAYLGDFARRKDGISLADAVAVVDNLLALLHPDRLKVTADVGTLSQMLDQLETTLTMLVRINSVSAIGCLKFTDTFARGMIPALICSQSVIHDSTPVALSGVARSCAYVLDELLENGQLVQKHEAALTDMKKHFDVKRDDTRLRADEDMFVQVTDAEYEQVVTKGAYLDTGDHLFGKVPARKAAAGHD